MNKRILHLAACLIMVFCLFSLRSAGQGGCPLSGTSTICMGTTTTITLGGASVGSVTWSSSDVTVATVDASGNVFGIGPGPVTIFYTDGAGSCSFPMTIDGVPHPISGPSDVCLGNTALYTDFATGGTWVSMNTAVATIDIATGMLYTVSLGSTTVRYTVSNTCTGGSPVTIGMVVNVDPMPNAGTITGASSNVCTSGPTLSLSSSGTGGGWVSSDPSLATVDGFGTVTGVAAGTVIISYIVPSPCSTAVATYLVTVDAPPGPIMGPIDVCAGSTINLSDASPGGTWVSIGLGVATINSTGTVFGISPGTSEISYTVNNSCTAGAVTLTTTVTVHPLPNVGPITGTTFTLCRGSNISLGATPIGGTWSTSDPSVAPVSPGGIVFGAGGGTATITYTMTSVWGCINYSTQMVTVDLPPGPIMGHVLLCSGTSTLLTNDALGGTWSSTNPGVATIDATGMLFGVSGGSATISYVVSNTCTSGLPITHTLIINVEDPLTAGTILGSTPICPGTTLALTNPTGAPGGNWSSSDFTIASVNPTSGIVTGMSGGTAIITYSVGNVCGVVSTTIAVTVYPAPNAGTISGSNVVCVGLTTTLSDGGDPGSWSSSNTAVASIDASTGVVTGIAGGTADISYTATNSFGCISYATYTMTVETTPVTGTIIGTLTVCSGLTTALSDPTGAPGGTWSSTDPSVATADASGLVTGVTGGTSIISYTVTNSCGPYPATVIVTVNPTPSVAAITGTFTVCEGSTTLFADATGGGVWSSGNTSVATVNSAGLVFGVLAGTADISYAITSGAGCVGYAVQTVTVNPLPSIAAITGTTGVCVGSSTTLADATGGGVWSSSTPAVASINASTGDCIGVTAGTATITYSVTSGAGCTAYALTTVTVYPLPTVAAITGTFTVCTGSTTALADATGSGAWSSSDPYTAYVDASTGVVTGIAAGTADITYTVTTGFGCSAYALQTVTVNTTPGIAVITGIFTRCVGVSFTLIDAIGGGVWSSSASSIASINPSSGTYIGVSAGTATITYTITSGAGCSAYALHDVTVFPLPTVAAITGTLTVCAGLNTTLADVTGGGAWSSSITSVATVNSSGVVHGVSPGTSNISYSVTSGSGCVGYAVVTVTVYPTPVVATITGIFTVCTGTTTPLADATTGGVWTSSNTAKATVNSSGVVGGVAAGVGHYYLYRYQHLRLQCLRSAWRYGRYHSLGGGHYGHTHRMRKCYHYARRCYRRWCMDQQRYIHCHRCIRHWCYYRCFRRHFYHYLYRNQWCKLQRICCSYGHCVSAAHCSGHYRYLYCMRRAHLHAGRCYCRWHLEQQHHISSYC